jgi:threonine 3-dehydrogenase
MSILVTGGTGFIGAEIVRQLVDEGCEGVTVFDINPVSKLLQDIEHKVEIVRGDLGNMSHVMNIVAQTKPDAIYHLGGMLSAPSDADHAASFRANAMGTFHVLEAARLMQVPQVLFSSTIAVYGYDLAADSIDDFTLERPQLFYGATKVFGENMGLFYKRKFGLDFRSVRYPAIVGPGVKTPGVVQYNSWAIEECAQGRAYSIYVDPQTRCPVMYYKDSAASLIQLAKAPAENIKMVNYLVTGFNPPASAGELAEIVRQKIPGAKLDFKPDPEIQKVISGFLRTLDDSKAREEWGWRPQYDQERIVEDMLLELKQHPERYV